MKLSELNIKKINLNDIDKDYSGQDILMKLGELYQFESGIYGYGNIFTKLKRTIENIIIEELDKVGCVEVEFPKLQPKSIWERSNRWDTYTKDGDIMFTLDNNLGEYGLAPTAEECATIFGANRLLSYKNLPCVYYQIGNKFRKEIRTRGYVFRTREFDMMDAYSFAKNESEMKEVYERIYGAYLNIFKRIGIKILPTMADNGAFGGSVSHEWQAELSLGEDVIYYDENMQIGINSEVLEMENSEDKLNALGVKDASNLKKCNAIELGHTFQLGTKYSEDMKLYYKDEDDSDKPYYMGCYGIGPSRIVANIIENNVIRVNDKIKGFVLPYTLSPYKVQLIYTEDNKDKAFKLYEYLLNNGINALLDDRENLTIGNRINDVYVLGTPKMIILGSRFDGIHFEIEDTKTNEKVTTSYEDITSIFRGFNGKD